MSDIIYKFLTAENALKVLEQSRLKVGLLRELNDVYDCAPVYGPMGKEPGFLPQWWSEYVVNLNFRTYGLLCFSKTLTSPLLWGHYAACSSGIALGFDPAHFTWEDRIEVSYDRSRPILQWPKDRNMTPEDWQELFRTSFGVKAEEWRYEKEVRYVVKLAECEPRSGMYFAGFHGRALREVIVGCRCSVTPTYLQHFLGSHYRGLGVSIHIAHEHPTLFEIAIRPHPDIPPKLETPADDAVIEEKRAPSQ